LHRDLPGTPLLLTARGEGRSSTSVTQRYAHVVVDAAGNAVDAAGPVFTASTQTSTQPAPTEPVGGGAVSVNCGGR
jgi:hypothetical protein